MLILFFQCSPSLSGIPADVPTSQIIHRPKTDDGRFEFVAMHSIIFDGDSYPTALLQDDRYRHPIPGTRPVAEDRKSTRLNSSHVAISYAVFCLKKKKHTS